MKGKGKEKSDRKSGVERLANRNSGMSFSWSTGPEKSNILEKSAESYMKSARKRAEKGNKSCPELALENERKNSPENSLNLIREKSRSLNWLGNGYFPERYSSGADSKFLLKEDKECVKRGAVGSKFPYLRRECIDIEIADMPNAIEKKDSKRLDKDEKGFKIEGDEASEDSQYGSIQSRESTRKEQRDIGELSGKHSEGIRLARTKACVRDHDSVLKSVQYDSVSNQKQRMVVGEGRRNSCITGEGEEIAFEGSGETLNEEKKICSIYVPGGAVEFSGNEQGMNSMIKVQNLEAGRTWASKNHMEMKTESKEVLENVICEETRQCMNDQRTQCEKELSRAVDEKGLVAVECTEATQEKLQEAMSSPQYSQAATALKEDKLYESVSREELEEREGSEMVLFGRGLEEEENQEERCVRLTVDTKEQREGKSTVEEATKEERLRGKTSRLLEIQNQLEVDIAKPYNGDDSVNQPSSPSEQHFLEEGKCREFEVVDEREPSRKLFEDEREGLRQEADSRDKEEHSLEEEREGLGQEADSRAKEEQSLEEEREGLGQEADSRAKEEQSLEEEREGLGQEADSRAKEEQNLEEEREGLGQEADSRTKEEQSLEEEREGLGQEADSRTKEEQSLEEEREGLGQEADSRARGGQGLEEERWRTWPGS